MSLPGATVSCNAPLAAAQQMHIQPHRYCGILLCSGVQGQLRVETALQLSSQKQLTVVEMTSYTVYCSYL